MEVPEGKGGKGGKVEMGNMDDVSDSLEDGMDNHNAKGGMHNHHMDNHMMMSGMGADGMPPLQPGRVVLVVPDMELVEFFRQQVRARAVGGGHGVGRGRRCARGVGGV